MGLAHDRRVRSTLRQRRIQFSERRHSYHLPSDIGMGTSACRQEGGLIWKRKFSHLRGGGGGRLAPEPQGVQKEVRAVPKKILEDITRDGGQDQKNVRSPMETLVNTVSHMQRDSRTKIVHTKNTSHLTGDSGSPAGGTHDYESAAVRWNY